MAGLSRRLGFDQLDKIEDAVQFAMMQALESWVRTPAPDNPAAWLFQVAYRHVISRITGDQRKRRLLNIYAGKNDGSDPVEPPMPGELQDDLLKMLFVSCSDRIAVESQLVFTLKALCGFNVQEIATRLFTTPANVYKRFTRARQGLQSENLAVDGLSENALKRRLSAVQRVLYLLFTEGSLSSHPDTAIRKDLCMEAMRLATLTANSSIGDTPDSHALLALMYLHFARIPGREDNKGELVLLKQQDRSKWSRQHIKTGLQHLAQASEGEHISKYHVEAGIAAEHCLAENFESTRWDRIVDAYALLESMEASALHVLNRAIALAQWQGPEAGLALLNERESPAWLIRSYHWHAVLADLNYRCQNVDTARRHNQQAIKLAPTDHIKAVLRKRFRMYDQKTEEGRV